MVQRNSRQIASLRFSASQKMIFKVLNQARMETDKRLCFRKSACHGYGITNPWANEEPFVVKARRGSLDAYNDRMRYAMVNLRNSDGMAISDSLVEVYPDWASAHLGQLHYYILANDEANLRATLAEAQSKLEGASLAEKTLISAYNPDLTRAERRETVSGQSRCFTFETLPFAGDDPMLKFWYTWTLDGNDEKSPYWNPV